MALQREKDYFINYNYKTEEEIIVYDHDTYIVEASLGSKEYHIRDKRLFVNSILRKNRFAGVKIFIEDGVLKSDIIRKDLLYYDEVEKFFSKNNNLKKIECLEKIDIGIYKCLVDKKVYVYKKCDSKRSCLNEIKSLARLSGTGVCPKLESIIICENVVTGILMEYISGEYLKSKEHLQECLKKLKIIHNYNIVHCDLKPQNIIISNGRLFIIDFGSSNVDGVRSDHSHTLGYYKRENPSKEEEIESLKEMFDNLECVEQ